jgi:hypothetical protein
MKNLERSIDDDISSATTAASSILNEAAKDALRRSPNSYASSILFETADHLLGRPVSPLTRKIVRERAEEDKKK